MQAGDTALHEACLNGHLDVTSLLINSGIDIYSHNKVCN